jgi:hypothetical protein
MFTKWKKVAAASNVCAVCLQDISGARKSGRAAHTE